MSQQWTYVAVKPRACVPLVQTLILVGIDVRARSRFDRFTHHAHGHGGWIAAGGDVGSRFPVARSVDDGASASALGSM